MTRTYRSRIACGLSLVATLFVLLCLSAPAEASAIPFITVSDLTEGLPTWSVGPGVDVIGGSVVIAPETLSFDAILHIPFGFGVLVNPQYTFALLEPGGGLSDLATITTPHGNGGSGQLDWEQFIHFDFKSIDDPVVPETTCSAVENGDIQSCTFVTQTTDQVLTINLQSDVVESVPEPTSLTLIGAGLVGLVTVFRRKAIA